MKSLPRLLLLAVVLAVVSACETAVEVELPEHEPKLVVNGLFHSDSLWAVELSHSIPAGEDEVPEENLSEEHIEEATVTITRNGTVVDTLRPQQEEDRDDVFRSATHRPEAGQTYTLRARVPGYDPVEATSYVPAAVPFEAHTGALGGEWRDVTVRLADPAGERNYYTFALLRRQTYRYADGDTSYTRSSVQQWPFESADPVFVTGQFDCAVVSEGTPRYRQVFFSDQSFAGQTREISLSARFVESHSGRRTNEYIAVLYTLSEPYFQFLQSFRNSCDFSNPFAEPEEVQGNVEGGFGVFAGSSVRRVSIYRSDGGAR